MNRESVETEIDVQINEIDMLKKLRVGIWEGR
jgi:hypothetical protein